jgi:[protein-PII] uridylyltransferase
VATRDRAGLFALLAGTVAASLASVVGAEAYTRADGIALDHLTLTLPAYLAGDERFWQKLERNLRAVLSGERPVEELVDAARRRLLYQERAEGPPAPAEVEISNELSDRFTVIDVGARDRPGLLYGLLRALGALGLDLHAARISTRADRAVDVFYVSEGGGKVTDPAQLSRVRSALVGVAEDEEVSP